MNFNENQSQGYLEFFDIFKFCLRSVEEFISKEIIYCCVYDAFLDKDNLVTIETGTYAQKDCINYTCYCPEYGADKWPAKKMERGEVLYSVNGKCVSLFPH